LGISPTRNVSDYTPGQKSVNDFFVTNSTISETFPEVEVFSLSSYTTRSFSLPIGQVAQLVERGPEKAGVGGSIPSLATNPFKNLSKKRCSHFS
jgi:hypothetical protein